MEEAVGQDGLTRWPYSNHYDELKRGKLTFQITEFQSNFEIRSYKEYIYSWL